MIVFGTQILIIWEIFEIVIPLKLLRKNCPLEGTLGVYHNSTENRINKEHLVVLSPWGLILRGEASASVKGCKNIQLKTE